MAIINTWWAEKYRPQTIDEYVAEPEFAAKIKTWLEKGEINHLLLHSATGGSGKTSLAKLIANSLDADVYYINASMDNGIDMIRDRILPFASSVGFKRWKIVILDEGDGLTPNFQSACRPIMEQYSKNTRFIITCNYVDKIIQPIRSRCTEFLVETPPKAGVMKRMKYILDNEEVKYEDKDVANVIKQLYPDQRSIINYLQDNSTTGTFTISKQNIAVNDYCAKIVEQFRTKNSVKDIFTNIRTLLADTKVRQFNDLYRYLFDHLDEYAVDGTKGQIIITLADYQYKDSMVIDKEINVMACIVNILNIIKG